MACSRVCFVLGFFFGFFNFKKKVAQRPQRRRWGKSTLRSALSFYFFDIDISMKLCWIFCIFLFFFFWVSVGLVFVFFFIKTPPYFLPPFFFLISFGESITRTRWSIVLRSFHRCCFLKKKFELIFCWFFFVQWNFRPHRKGLGRRRFGGVGGRGPGGGGAPPIDAAHQRTITEFYLVLPSFTGFY